ncbi:hypothetical protein F5148DRAFT_1283375 [Russula earlei]|uniref:Uncharacterized protein n=1 Tax=Russula earlei TaxID=71964 RepID=A0ACC0UDY1_9AGAM|nr:hypothetical protein F5148DRAFT_1283375 [Russula earlei]
MSPKGNRFFEYPSLRDDPPRARRRVRYKVDEDMWDYVGGAKRLPVQWVSWLSHTRENPPTLEELRADLARQRRVLYNASIIEARDREERARISAAAATPITEVPATSTPQGIRTRRQASSPDSFDVLERPQPSSETHELKRPSLPSHGSALPAAGKDRDWQPAAWTPRTMRRRGG